MLTATHKSILNAMAQIITNTDGFIRYTTCLFGGEETHTIIVADSPLGNFFEFEGSASTFEGAYEAVLREFETCSMGCPRSELFLAVAMKDAESLIEDVSESAALDAIEIPVSASAPKTRGHHWDDPRYQSEETRRFVKQTDNRYERRETRRALKSAV